MPSVISHAALGTALKISFGPKGIPSSFLPVAIACSVVPDADSIGFYLGIPYGHFLGHRGFFHSPFFALILSFLCMVLLFRGVQPFSRPWFSGWILLFLATASHGVLDAFTNGGSGVSLLVPFSRVRYFSPWRPIIVSPIGIEPFFSRRGFAVMKAEFLYIWLPSLLMVVVSALVRMWRATHPGLAR